MIREVSEMAVEAIEYAEEHEVPLAEAAKHIVKCYSLTGRFRKKTTAVREKAKEIIEGRRAAEDWKREREEKEAMRVCLLRGDHLLPKDDQVIPF